MRASGLPVGLAAGPALAPGGYLIRKGRFGFNFAILPATIAWNGIAKLAFPAPGRLRAFEMTHALLWIVVIGNAVAATALPFAAWQRSFLFRERDAGPRKTDP